MKIYKDIRVFEIKELIENGKTVFCFDKKEQTICEIKAMTVEKYFDVYNDEKNRYYLWLEEVKEEQEEKEV